MPRISDYEKREKLRVFRDSYIGILDTLAESLYSGRITLGFWEEDMRTRMREYLVGCAMIGKGDATEVTSSDWGKVGAQLKKQYRWLHGFAQAISDNRNTISLAAIKARAHLYAEAGMVTATEIQAGYFAPNVRRTPKIILPWIPGDGSTVCLNRCKCEWELSVIGTNPLEDVKIVRAVWMLRPAEHCEDCVPRDGHVEIVEVPIDVEVPMFIGLGGS